VLRGSSAKNDSDLQKLKDGKLYPKQTKYLLMIRNCHRMSTPDTSVRRYRVRDVQTLPGKSKVHE